MKEMTSPTWPLKPSLVEWKLHCRTPPDVTLSLLETFLGGMETSEVHDTGAFRERLETFLGGMETLWPNRRMRARRNLETFLGGMETGRTGTRTTPRSDLETFLGGMETVIIDADLIPDLDLETFLGGMETYSPQRIQQVGGGSLKPSLVEWKQRKML